MDVNLGGIPRKVSVKGINDAIMALGLDPGIVDAVTITGEKVTATVRLQERGRVAPVVVTLDLPIESSWLKAITAEAHYRHRIGRERDVAT